MNVFTESEIIAACADAGANGDRVLTSLRYLRQIGLASADACSSCGGTGSQGNGPGHGGCTDCLGTGVDPMSDRARGVATVVDPLQERIRKALEVIADEYDGLQHAQQRHCIQQLLGMVRAARSQGQDSPPGVPAIAAPDPVAWTTQEQVNNARAGITAICVKSGSFDVPLYLHPPAGVKEVPGGHD